MNDPLTSINAEEVEKNVMDAYKTMHKSVKIFNEIPSMYVARVCARAYAGGSFFCCCPFFKAVFFFFCFIIFLSPNVCAYRSAAKF